MTDVDRALHDPSEVYRFPHDVVEDQSISKEDKLKILQQWEYDAREIQVADEENMVGDSASMLHRVHEALHEVENQD